MKILISHGIRLLGVLSLNSFKLKSLNWDMAVVQFLKTIDLESLIFQYHMKESRVLVS